MKVCNTLAYSLQSNDMSESLVKTIKKDYAYLNNLSDTQTILTQIDEWFKDYNANAPHKGLKMLSPNKYRRLLNLNEIFCIEGGVTPPIFTMLMPL
ncbi:hypothetical protein EBS43_02015 [bacterium]|nr:hypothetical protein [bacterium]